MENWINKLENKLKDENEFTLVTVEFESNCSFCNSFGHHESQCEKKIENELEKEIERLEVKRNNAGQSILGFEWQREQNKAEIKSLVLEAQITNMDLDIFNPKMRKLVAIQDKIKDELTAAWKEYYKTTAATTTEK